MKIAVIGAGLAGLGAAWYLARDGHEVTVIERRGAAALETSHANATLLTVSLTDPLVSPAMIGRFLSGFGTGTGGLSLRPAVLWETFTWSLRALRHLRPARVRAGTRANLALARLNIELLDRLETECPELGYDRAARGTLMVFRSRRGVGGLRRQADTLARFGIAHEVLDPNGVLEAEPALRGATDRFQAGLFCPEDEHGDPARFCRGLESSLRSRGVRFHFGREVTGLRIADHAVRSMETDNGPLEADAYVLAAGPGSAYLSRLAGVRAPIYPVKGYSITTALPPNGGAPAVPVLDAEWHISMAPIGGRLRVAGYAEMSGFDPSISPERIAHLQRHARALFPQLPPESPAEAASAWAGFRPVTADGLPMIGRTTLENLYANTGHGTLGWTHAMASGLCLADLLAGRQPPIDPGPFAPTRFGRERGTGSW